jgi:serine/threonine protein kinase
MFLAWVAIDLLERLLQFDPAKRITAAEALQHAYFTSAGLGPNSGGPVPTPYPPTQQGAVMPQPPPGQYNYPHPPQSGVVYSNPQIAQIPQPQPPPPQQQNGFGQYPPGYAHASR